MSSPPTTATVFYPFHPLAQRTVKVIVWPRIPEKCATVEPEDGVPLKIPRWMLEPAAARFRLSELITLPPSVLQELARFCTEQKSGMVSGDLPTEAPHAASPAGPRRSTRPAARTPDSP